MKHLLKEGKITRLFSDEGGGDTGEVHLLKHKGKKYVLRIAPDIKTAKKYVEIYNGLEKYKILPKLLHYSGKNIIFEYIEGRDLINKDISPKIAYSVGKITGCISNLKDNKSKTYNFNKKFFKRLKFILTKKTISKEKYDIIYNLYNKLINKTKVISAMDITDPTSDNFRLQKDTGKVYFIDIEAIKPGPKSIGISKAFLRWFKTEKQRNNFLRGYNSVSNGKYITKDYLQFIYLYHLVQSLYSRISDGRDPSERLEMLNKLLEGELK
jgi:thiamine kinase-like enzyme